MTSIARVKKAKDVRKGDRVLVVSLEQQEWREVTDVYDGGYGLPNVTICYGDGYDNQESFDPRDRVLVSR